MFAPRKKGRKRQKKELSADTLIYRLMNGYYASRWCMHPSEIKTLEIYIKTGMLHDRKVKQKLDDFGFDIEGH